MSSPDAWDAPIPFESSASLPVFPVDALPAWLRQFVEEESIATQTPPDLAAMLALAGLAVACAKKVAVLVRPGWCEPVNIFVAVALPPGCRKTRVFSDVEEPIRTFEAEVVRGSEQFIAEAENRNKILQGRLLGKQAQAAKAKSDADQRKLSVEADALAKELAASHPPARLRLIADDVTPERLVSMLGMQGGRLAVLSSEGGIFDMMAGRYSKDGSANFEVFLKGHAGDDLRVDRVGRPSEFVSKPALSLGLAVQPSVLSGLASKPGFRGRGLLGRFSYSLPFNNLGRRIIEPPPLTEAVREAFNQNMNALLSLPFSQDDRGKAKTEFLRFSPEAAKCLISFLSWIEPQLSELGPLGAMTDWAGKLVGLVARLAGLLHMAKHCNDATPWSVPIAQETVEAAVRIGKYLIPHARTAFALMGADPAVEQAKQVLAWVRKQGLQSFSKRELFNGLRGRFHKVRDLDPVLLALVDHDFVRLIDTQPPGGPGRKPSPKFEVNPLVLKGNSAYCADSAVDRGTSILGERSHEDMSIEDATQNPHNAQNSDEYPYYEPGADPELARRSVA